MKCVLTDNFRRKHMKLGVKEDCFEVFPVGIADKFKFTIGKEERK